MENELISAFSQLSLSDKRKAIGRELTETTMMFKTLLSNISEEAVPDNVDEYKNLFDSDLTEDEYLTGYYEDFLYFKNIMSAYLNAITIDKYEN